MTKYTTIVENRLKKQQYYKGIDWKARHFQYCIYWSLLWFVQVYIYIVVTETNEPSSKPKVASIVVRFLLIFIYLSLHSFIHSFVYPFIRLFLPHFICLLWSLIRYPSLISHIIPSNPPSVTKWVRNITFQLLCYR